MRALYWGAMTTSFRSMSCVTWFGSPKKLRTCGLSSATLGKILSTVFSSPPMARAMLHSTTAIMLFRGAAGSISLPRTSGRHRSSHESTAFPTPSLL